MQLSLSLPPPWLNHSCMHDNPHQKMSKPDLIGESDELKSSKEAPVARHLQGHNDPFMAESPRGDHVDLLCGSRKSACKTPWESMSGTDRVRICPDCDLKVYKVEGLDRDSMLKLISDEEPSMSDRARLFRRYDATYTLYSGRILTGVKLSLWYAGFGLLMVATGIAWLGPLTHSALESQSRYRIFEAVCLAWYLLGGLLTSRTSKRSLWLLYLVILIIPALCGGAILIYCPIFMSHVMSLPASR
jgi:hypothetical protein